MNTTVILTVIGSDRPGLTGALAEAVLAAGGNWLEGQLTRLGGKYVGAVLVELPEDQLALLRETVRAVDAAGLKVEIIAGDVPTVAEAGGPLHLSIVGQDRLGIVREVTRALAEKAINIEAFESSTEDSPWSGGLLFKAEMALRPPASMTRADVQAVLESVSGEIMVDFAVAEPTLPAAHRSGATG